MAEESSYARLARLARWGAGAAVLYVLAVVVIRRRPFQGLHWTAVGPGFSALGIGFAAMIVFALAPRGPFKRLLETRALATLGKYSYGAYIIHTPIEPLYLKLFPQERLAHLAVGLGFTGSRLVGLLGFFVLGMTTTMLLAAVVFHLFEKPFLKLKRYFEYGSAADPEVAVATASPGGG